ncbi:hypothetical protein PG997_010667, partial [Apiospora hydei]
PDVQLSPPPASSNRQNEYFVPRDGIDREPTSVATLETMHSSGPVSTRYFLLVLRDPLFQLLIWVAAQSPQTGQVVQGYFITAYRNLTTAMIEDLKADSARWDQERRQQTARNPVGGTIASAGVYVQKSNSPVVQYRNSDTHQSRQYYGPTEGANQYSDASRDNYDAGAPRYPGTGSAGYNGASSNSGYPGSSPYAGQSGGYGQQAYTTGQPQFAQSPPRLVPEWCLHVRVRIYPSPLGRKAIRGSWRTPNRRAGQWRLWCQCCVHNRSPGESPSLPQPWFRVDQSISGAYYSQNPAPTPAGFSAAQPVDSFYGRASPAGAGAFASTHDSQYENAPPPRNSAQPPSTQAPSSGSSSRHNRDNRDSVDRHTDSRHRSHRSGR